MAKFIDEREEELELNEGEELSNLQAPEEEILEETIEEESTEDSVDDEVPDKYRGKSVKEIITMHQEAEKLVGRQGQEVGELRRVVDQYINSQTVTQEKQAHNTTANFSDEDFFENPRETIQNFVDNHPSVKQSQQLALQLKKAEALAKLKAKHPDFADVLKNEKFAEWVQGSTIRKRLLVQADQEYDFDSADELLSLWKERSDVVNMTVEAEKKQRKQTLKEASTGTSRGSGERPSRKVYRRADLLELMQRDPRRYESLMPEIRQAYAEGRVK
jgi:predicted oxidoreductase (fatty acid repression mutant protein)